jgi:N-acetylglucosamine malate deacetylase 2
MKENFVCIFAHPDDEAFGPSGTIAKLAQKYNVYILCATKGEGGTDSDEGHAISIGKRRAQELRDSAKILGVKNVYFLGFKDGKLSNSLYHKLAAKVQTKLESFKPVGIMTFEPRGISGHIDHITVSLVTTYVFKKLPSIQVLWYYCITSARANEDRDYFIYFPPGYTESEIDLVVDVTDTWDKRVAAMMCHNSQRHDAETILKIDAKYPKEDHFLVMKKGQENSVTITL